jgi:Domain of unknown function (DUF5069)
MNTPIVTRDLTKEPPHSPRERFGGFAILGRTVDKCRATIARTAGEYHYDSPLDNLLFSFKGIDGAQFKKIFPSFRNYEDAAAWLQTNGSRKSPEQIKAWSDSVEVNKLRNVFAQKDAEHRKEVQESCQHLGLDYDTATHFEWLEADDQATFHAEMAAK